MSCCTCSVVTNIGLFAGWAKTRVPEANKTTNRNTETMDKKRVFFSPDDYIVNSTREGCQLQQREHVPIKWAFYEPKQKREREDNRNRIFCLILEMYRGCINKLFHFSENVNLRNINRIEA